MRRAILLSMLISLATACSDTPTSPDAVDTPPYTAIFASTITAQGAASRSFTALGSGEMTLTLTSTTPANIALGLGVGIPRDDGRGCHLARAVTTSAGTTAQIAMPMDAGAFCVQVYDVGEVAQQAGFSVTLTHP
ncbi:MAG: hypothetical protein IT178_09555 [Acidobacteria bacterium]|nr:hypothetical protein [Acidobacteriota bacterium]